MSSFFALFWCGSPGPPHVFEQPSSTWQAREPSQFLDRNSEHVALGTNLHGPLVRRSGRFDLDRTAERKR